MAQQLTMLVALEEDPSSVPSMHTIQLTTTYNPESGDLAPSPALSGTCLSVYTHIHK